MIVKNQRDEYRPHWSIDDHSKNSRNLLESKNENLESNVDSLINIPSKNVQSKTLRDKDIDSNYNNRRSSFPYDRSYCRIIFCFFILSFIFLTVFICFIFANLLLYREMALERLRRNLTMIQNSNNQNRSIGDQMNDDNGREGDDNDFEFAYNSGQDLKSNSVFIRNLTKTCMKRKNPCWFHPTVFPHSCKRTFCESVEYDVSYDENMAKIRFRPVTSVFEVNNIPDGTPCSPKSWCIKGRCTNVPVEELGRLKTFLEMTKNPEDGGWSNNCDTPKCLINRFDQKHHWNLFLMASKCPGAVCTAYTSQTRRLQFRSCTNPLPGNGGRACDITETAPISWGPVCQGCPPMFAGDEARKLTSGSILTAVCGRRGKFLSKEKCSCSRPNDVPLRFEDGAPCRTFENYTHNSDGFCFFGMCLGNAGYHRENCPLILSQDTEDEGITCPKLCQNGGNCVFDEQSNDYECQCPEDFNGQFCEKKDETWLSNKTCLLEACLNHGTCDPVTGICNCVLPFAGDFCEIEINSNSSSKAKNLPQCDKVLCQNGGTCSNITASLFQCSCPENIHGRYCEISTSARNSCPAGFTGAQCAESTIVSFYGDSLFAYLIPVDLRHPEFEFSLEFEFRTLLTDTILAVGESIFGKEFCLAILDGRLSLFVGKKRLINLHNFQVNGRHWCRTTLKINFTSSYAFLALYEEGEIVDLEKTRIEQRVRMSPIFVIKFGGVGEIFLKGDNDGEEAGYEPFVGCLYDIVVNGLLVYPRHFKGSSVVNVGYECPINRESLCLNNPCSHHGKCRNLLLKSVCVCDRPFYGSFCEMIIQEATFGHQWTASNVEIILNPVDSRRLFSRTPFDLSFFVKTRQKNATLFLADGAKNPIDSTMNVNDAGHFLWIGLANGRLCFKVKRIMGRNSEQISNASSPRLNNGFENFIEIHIDKENRILATLNSSLLIWKKNLDNVYSYQPPTTNLYIGGYPEKIQNWKKRFSMEDQSYFKGTLRDVRINNQLIELLPGKIMDKNLIILAATLLHRNVLSGTVSDDTCESGPCMNNGTCQVTFNDFLCDCTPGYFGRRCQFQDNCYNATCSPDSKCINLEKGAMCSGSATLSARNSLLAFTVLDQNHGESPDHMTVQFELRTRNVDGHVLSIVGHSGSLFMQILLSKGLLVLHSFDNMTQNHIVNSGLSINNGDWQKISMHFGQNSRFIVDQTEISLAHVYNPLSLKSLKLIFGGQWELGFDGCIRNVSLYLDDSYPEDGEEQEDTDGVFGVEFEIPFIMSKFLHEYVIGKFSVKVQKYEISDGCSGRDVCRESLCQNNSTCLDVFNSYKCQCGLGFSGPLCEVDIDECRSHKCQNGATCSDRVAGYTCHCSAGFNGTYCENQINDCNDTLCRNGGTCIDLTNDYLCHCDANFTGRNCETSLLVDCHSQPCFNGGMCRESPVALKSGQKSPRVTCACTSQFFGEFCEYDVDYCKDVDCKNNGTCLSDSRKQNFTCSCTTEFSGRYCQLDLSHGCKDDSCRHGICEKEFSEIPACRCFPGWTGPFCDNDIDECVDHSGPCINGGTCENLPGNFTCRCPDNYLGLFCEIEDICFKNPCRNGAECRQIDLAGYECICTHGFAGSNCEKIIGPCHFDPCKNGGLCIEEPGSLARCQCGSGFKGRHCEYKSKACDDKTCDENLYCLETPQGFLCACGFARGFSGPMCDLDIDECQMPEFCQHGVCENSHGGYNCTCADGFSGHRCDQIDPCSTLNGTENLTYQTNYSQCHYAHQVVDQTSILDRHFDYLLYIGFPAAIFACFVLLITCTMTILTVKANRATRGKYSPSRQELTGARVRFGPMMKPPPEERLI